MNEALHGLHLAAHDELRAAWQVLPEWLQAFIDIASHAAQIAVLRAGVNVNHRLHVVMRDDRRPRRRRQLHQVAQQLRIWARSGC